MKFGEVLDIWRNEPLRTFTREGWCDSSIVYCVPKHEVNAKDWIGPSRNIKDGETTVKIRAHLNVILNDGSVESEWCPWTEDMLAEDWIEVKEL